MRWSWRGQGLLASGVLTSAVMLSVACAQASASCVDGVYDEALPITSAVPTGGASVAPSPSANVGFSIMSPVHGVGLIVRVTTQNTLGQTGTLSDLNMV